MKKESDYIAIYSRKSRFTGKGESIENQVELCRDYVCRTFGKKYLEQILVYEDEGFSGGNLERPAFKTMMERARKHELQAVVVYRLDRISRNISDFAGLIQELNKLDVAFISLKEKFDTDSPMGRAMMYISSVFSQLERETIAERIRDNMHELAKTGRWLGGVTPTGYTSESVKSVSVDGKIRKSCRLKLIPEEAETVRMIFDLFLECDSLTGTETELLRRQIKTKMGKSFTRFSIKGILQNPVYLIADQEAYDYFVKKQSELCSELADFDGKCGILAYNRTDQEKGRAAIYQPESEWIVAVGQHPGLIPAKTWIKVQETLERNKSKGYRKPRNNEALLTGVLFCRCGDRMYPKLSSRVTADGEPIYTYVCKMKERSKRSRCNLRNANGNLLDGAVIGQMKLLVDDESDFIAQLERSRKFYIGDREQYEQQLQTLREERGENERKIVSLVDMLADLEGSAARKHVAKRIEELGRGNEELDAQITELETLAARRPMDKVGFDVLRQMLEIFRSSVDNMTVEEKRAAIRTVVRKVIWDGENAHIVLFGASEDEIEFPGFGRLLRLDGETTDEQEDLKNLSDVDYEENLEHLEGNVKMRLGEDRK